MTGPHKSSRWHPPLVNAAAVIPEAFATAEADMPIIDRPDGWYWQAPDGQQAFGPFESREEARADRDRFDEERPSPGETLQQAESEIGIADWLDAETGAPAEGQSPPHFEED